jgi:CPA1 family monovalent cation:H+ antiporter
VAISAALGAVAGFAASRILPSVGDHLIEISLSVVLAYGTYLAADALNQSGVIATAVAGITLGNYGRRLGLSPRTEEALDTVWEFVAFLATAFVFLVVGFAIAVHSLADAAIPIAWAICATLVARAVIVYGLLGGWRLLARRASNGRTEPAAGLAPVRAATKAARDEGDIPVDWLHVVFWSGLRGAVSTALALSLPTDFPGRAQLQAITFGVVLFTLAVQATTAELVVARWGRKPPKASKSKSKSKSSERAPTRARRPGDPAGVEASGSPVADRPGPTVDAESGR